MAIKIRVRLMGVLLGLAGENVITLNLSEPTVVGCAVSKLYESLPVEAKHSFVDLKVANKLQNALILVNGKEIGILGGLDTELNDGDEITLLPISHGG